MTDSAVPRWRKVIEEAFENDGGIEGLSEEMMVRSPQIAYLRPVAPLIAYGLKQIYAEVRQLYRQYALLPFDPQQIAHTLFALLPERLLAQLSKTFVLEMHVARIQQQLHGETPEARFADFIQQLAQKEKILALLEEYPALAHQCVTTIEQWADYAREFLRHLCTDWQDICSIFTPEHDPGPLVEVKGGAGDPHRKGRSVLTLTFSSGLQLLYKPRSLAVDVHFQELLSWLNKRSATFRTIKLVDRESYGWSEFVYAQSCNSRDEIARFYERQGSYLALLYALNAVDMHLENVIAAGEDPVLVDLEALFHPLVAGNDPTQPYYLGLTAMDQSVFRVGLLPHRIWSNQETGGIDLSGLGGEAGQLTPYRLPQWEAAGTDQMRLTRRHSEFPVKLNRPRLNGSDVDVLDYKANILAGFTTMYRLLQGQRDELRTEILPRFAHDEVRLLLRPSQRYATLLTESFHPDLLRDERERGRFFDRLQKDVVLRPYLSRVIPAEKRDLLQGDIPIFTTHPASCTLLTSNGEVLPEFFDESGLQLVERRLQHLDEQDLARQSWVIEAAMATLLIGPEQVSGKVLRVESTQASVDLERLLAAARSVGERLEQLAMRNEYGASWLGVSSINERAWSLLPTDIDLYSGTSGIALFLAYLGTITEEARYTLLAQSALSSLRSQLEQQKKYQQLPGIGVFDGLSSVIYLLTHLGVLWKDPTLLEEAESLAVLLPEIIASDERLDIISGSAGCILGLLSLYDVRPSQQTLEIAIRCGDHLLATAEPMQEGVAWTTIKHEQPLGGFSHGTAGIALSLFKLAASSGRSQYHQTALAALTYDRSLFRPGKQDWADLRALPSLRINGRGDSRGAEPRSSMVAWCHGAAGIGLSRLAVQSLLEDARIRDETQIALEAIINSGLMDNHSLCHGALGNLDILLTATQLIDDPHYREALAHMTALALESIAVSGWVTGVPLGIETPGLMCGLAGIGYTLLRLAEPDRIPSILLLAPPACASRTQLSQ